MELPDNEEFNDSHDMENLGEPTHIKRFEQGGVTYELKIWNTSIGAKRTIEIVGIDKDLVDLDFLDIKGDLNFAFNTKTVEDIYEDVSPTGFLQLLSKAAEAHDEMHGIAFHGLESLELTEEEQIEQLEEDLQIAVAHEDYESAGEIKVEIDRLNKK